ncbi:MAG: hypothetical protein KDD53_06245, partial [Bdellovibrionales bacterium]|nr:hypothetical protein [Bdellovibrionales bacterium]
RVVWFACFQAGVIVLPLVATFAMQEHEPLNLSDPVASVLVAIGSLLALAVSPLVRKAASGSKKLSASLVSNEREANPQSSMANIVSCVIVESCGVLGFAAAWISKSVEWSYIASCIACVAFVLIYPKPK